MSKQVILEIKHYWWVFRDFIKYSFAKSKQTPIINDTKFSAMSFNLRKDTIDDKSNCCQFRKNDVVNFILNEKNTYRRYAGSYASYV